MVTTKKYSYIDSLRGYAVIMVLATHVFAFGGVDANPGVALAKTMVQCRMGVMLFYIISALTLFLSYDKKSKLEKRPVKNFFIRRFFRIVPLFYLVCGYMVFTHSFGSTEIWGTLTFTNGFMPPYINGIVVGGWSIAVESIFYFMIPLLFKHITNIKRSAFFLLACIGLAIVLRSLAFRYLGHYFSNDVLLSWTLDWLPMQMPVFAMGIFLYFLLFKSNHNHEPNTVFYKSVSYLLTFLSIYIFIIASYSSRLFVFENISFGFILVLFVLGCALYPGSVFNNRLMQFLGKISYSFYLFHPIVISVIGLPVLHKIAGYGNPTIGFVLCYVLILIITSLVSYVSYLFIEQKFQQLGTAMITRSEK